MFSILARHGPSAVSRSFSQRREARRRQCSSALECGATRRFSSVSRLPLPCQGGPRPLRCHPSPWTLYSISAAPPLAAASASGAPRMYMTLLQRIKTSPSLPAQSPLMYSSASPSWAKPTTRRRERARRKERENCLRRSGREGCSDDQQKPPGSDAPTPQRDQRRGLTDELRRLLAHKAQTGSSRCEHTCTFMYESTESSVPLYSMPHLSFTITSCIEGRGRMRQRASGMHGGWRGS